MKFSSGSVILSIATFPFTPRDLSNRTVIVSPDPGTFLELLNCIL
jgi:hypothetical protein